VIDLVLPLAISTKGHSDVDRARILLRSLQLRFDPATLGTIFVVCQANQTEFCEGSLRDIDLPFRFIDEREVIGETRIMNWRKQQLIKLAIAERTSEFYLVLDADILCRRSLSASDLIRDGRGVVSACAKSFFREWYENSAKTLGLKVDWEAPGIGVTPQVLCCEVVRLLIRHLEHKYRRPWLEVLGRSEEWTEFTLYLLILEQYRLFDLFHVWGDLSGGDVWNLPDFDNWKVADLPGFFSVLQSNTGLSPDAVRQRLPAHFLQTR
jgi:hypothetical protein